MTLKKYIPFVLFFFFGLSRSFSQTPGSLMPADFCITVEEDSLLRMLNTFRQSQGLQPLAPSKSLCYVAHVHALDLYYYHPDRRPCSLHSWSEGGRWTACCYSDKDPKYGCMWNKPKELTNYKGKGYELAFMENDTVGPQEPYNMWTTHEVTSDILLNRGRWKTKSWKAIGVALYRGYALLWFGEEADAAGSPEHCTGQTVSQKPTKDTLPATESKQHARNPSFYLIAASYDTWEKANSMAGEYKTKGYPETVIIYGDKKYRVALMTCATLSEAKKELNKLSQKVNGLWILQK
jgi:hypothetical protein